MFYSEILQSIRHEANSWTLNVSEDWMQGRSVFGGIQVALAVRAMRSLIPTNIPLRALQTTFISPVPTGVTRAKAQILRTGKNTIHVEARLTDGDQVLASMMGVFGTARTSKIVRVPQQPTVECVKPLEFKFVSGHTPNFTQHFSAFWLRGGLPFTGNPLPEAVIKISMRDSEKATESHVLAIADFIPPVALSMLNAPTAGSSLMWQIEFLTDSFGHLPLEDWRVDAELTAGRDGYTSQSAMIWNPSGEPMALSRQSMVVFG